MMLACWLFASPKRRAEDGVLMAPQVDRGPEDAALGGGLGNCGTRCQGFQDLALLRPQLRGEVVWRTMCTSPFWRPTEYYW